ncbi:hypothetical protein CR513_47166, partial [Mucuna pruriens]
MSNLIYVGRLVDNDCRWDQRLGKIIAKGPKVGRLFPIHFLSSPNLSLSLVSCNSAHFDFISCKLGKSKILPFPTHHLNVTQPFDIIHIVSLGFIFYTQKMKCFPLSNYFMLMFKPKSLSKSKFFALIMEGNTPHTQFRNSCNPMTLYLKGHAHQPPKQKNRHLLNVVHTLLLESHVSSRFWCKSLPTTIHLINKLSSSSLGNESSFTRLFSHPPDYFTLCIFGCVLCPSSSTRTYQAHCTICSMCFSWLFSSLKGFSNIFFATQYDSLHSPIAILPLFSNSLVGPSQDNFLVVAPIKEPESATLRPQFMHSKFVFSIKLCLDGSIDRYKAWLVVLGNKQQYGLDYDETFVPIVKITIVCTLLAMVASQSWSLHQMDVKNAFLHDDLKEEVYIKLLYGIHTPFPNIVCKPKCSLYGLKQA